MNKKRVLLLVLVLFIIAIGSAIALHRNNTVTLSNPADKENSQKPSEEWKGDETEDWGRCVPASSVTPITKSGSSLGTIELGFEKVDDSWNRLFVPFYGYKVKGYCMKYPSNWKISLAGAENQTTYFNRDNDSATTPEFYLETVRSALPLEDSDKESYAYEHSSSPLVGRDEVVVSRQIEQIGDNKALVLVTRDSDTYRLHLFVKNGTTLRVLERSFSSNEYGSSVYTDFFALAYEMISSLRPLGN